ncbi:hypothetical protein T484DRAFT_1957982 [Baffinella frigidus]|nr:hypothetical protein T484DRAFT_1957982 [Cryptophyta sp. CCMP2293]
MEKRLVSQMAAMMEKTVDKMASMTEATLARIDRDAKNKAAKDKLEMQRQTEGMAGKLVQVLEASLSRTLSEQVGKDIQREVAAAVVEAFKVALTAVVKPPVDAATKAAGDKTVAAMKPALQESFKTSFQASLIPAFESSCQRMFEQIHATFEKGVAERAETDKKQAAAVGELQKLQKAADALTTKLSALEEKAAAVAAMPLPTSPVAAQAHGAAQAAQATAANAAAAAAAAQQQQQQQQEELAATERQRAELAASLAGLLQESKFEEAFSKVLSLSDLKLVTWLCKSVDARYVLKKEPRLLSPPVVLSLVQQLGFDLTRDAELKVTWLRDAIMLLDHRDAIVGAHVPGIIKQLQINLSALERNPDAYPIVQTNDFHLLLLVIKSIAE